MKRKIVAIVERSMKQRTFIKKPIPIKATQWFKNGDHPDDYVGDSFDHKEDGPDEMSVSGVKYRGINYTSEFRRENNWEGGVVRYFRRPNVSGELPCKHCSIRMHEHGWIDTLEGGHIVCPGDWIATGIDGEHWPIKPSVFERTYEEVNVFFNGVTDELSIDDKPSAIFYKNYLPHNDRGEKI